MFTLGLDSDYVEYLKTKKQKELDTEQAMNTEQKQSIFFLINELLFSKINISSASCS